MGGGVLDMDRGVEARRVHVIGRRCVQDGHPGGRGEGRIRVHVPRVLLEVTAHVELHRVDEDGEDHIIGQAPCLPHQLEMAVVESAHRGDECNGASVRPLSAGEATHRGSVVDDEHGQSKLWASSGQVPRRTSVA